MTEKTVMETAAENTEKDISCGYAGKILRVNLTNQTTEEISSSKYLPEYLGGKTLCCRIFWDEVMPGTGALDPSNKLILAPGPTTGTGIPTGGRTTMCGIGANSLPEQLSSGSVGGRIGTVLKYAGYDALIIEGKAPYPMYVLIENDQVSFLDADLIWGMLVHDASRALTLAHGTDSCNMVIGPAGENLVRIATVTTGVDHAFSKSGFGAVFGSKNLKAVVIKGDGAVKPGNIEKILELRGRIGEPKQIVNRQEKQPGFYKGADFTEGEWTLCRYACSPGCTSRCQPTMIGTQSVFTGGEIDQLEKCVSRRGANMTRDYVFPTALFITTPQNNRTQGMNKSWDKQPDPTDPEWDFIQAQATPGDTVNFYGPNFARGVLMNQMTNEFGLDKWDIVTWYFTWIGMAKKEGLLEDMDFGMEPDMENPEFVRKFLIDITYRRGIGDIFAEGMARAVRKLGKEKYGDTIYHGRTSASGEARELPVNLETAWGQAAHWSGRGFQATPKWLWLINSLMAMVNTRDPIASGHIHLRPDQIRQIMDEGVSESQLLIDVMIKNELDSFIKDSLTACEWQSPHPFWREQETEMYRAATGKMDTTVEDLYAMADRGRLLFRAVLMRNFGRCRDLEVPQPYPNMTYPDPKGETATWDEWNDVVDRYYRTNGWDLETGWPYRSTWEKAGLKDIADEMEKLGMLPPEGRTEYVRKPNPFNR